MGIDAETYAAAKAYVDHEIEGGGGTLDYEALRNHPSINGNELVGNKSSKQLGIQNLFTGTTAEWAQLTADQKAQYTHVCFTDDTAQEVIVVANPEAQATAELTKLQVGQGVYSIPSGEAVADNTSAIEAIVNEYGAKNLSPIKDISGTQAGLTVTMNSDGSITFHAGTSTNTSNAFIFLDITRLKAGQYYYSGGLSTSFNDKIALLTHNYSTINEADFLFTADGISNYGMIILIYPQITLSQDVTFYPMIRDARITDPTYVPYAMTNRELTEKITTESGGQFYGVYPNGHAYGATDFSITIPYYNPQQKNISVSSAYVYDDNGNFVDITSDVVTVHSLSLCYCGVNFTFNSAHAGKLLRIDYTFV